MNSYLAFRGWFHRLDAKTEAGLVVLTLAVLASVIFGALPDGTLLLVKAALSGAVWLTCLLVLILGGERIDRISTVAVALILGGMTTSIPSLFYTHDTPVAWGAALSHLGYLILVLRLGYDIAKRWHHEREGKDKP